MMGETYEGLTAPRPVVFSGLGRGATDKQFAVFTRNEETEVCQLG